MNQPNDSPPLQGTYWWDKLLPRVYVVIMISPFVVRVMHLVITYIR